MNKVIILGATGFIGRHLVHAFRAQNFHVVTLTRNPQKARRLFGPLVKCLPFMMHDPSNWAEELLVADALINLIGENISSHFWTASYREKLKRSRIESVQTVFKALQKINVKSVTYLQASAVGYYGNTQIPVDEQGRAGNDFLARLTADWEQASDPIAQLGNRRILMRFGLVLGRDGGAFPKMVKPYRWFLGAVLGNGKQGVSWMHIDDVVRAIHFLLKNTEAQEVFNFTSPNPVSQKEWHRTLARLLHRPSFLRIPAWLIRAALGEMGQSLFLNGQYALPAALTRHGFQFRFPQLETALQDVLNTKLP